MKAENYNPPVERDTVMSIEAAELQEAALSRALLSLLSTAPDADPGDLLATAIESELAISAARRALR